MDSVSSSVQGMGNVQIASSVRNTQSVQTQSQSSTPSDHTSNRDTFEYTPQVHTPVGVMYEGSGQVFPVSMGGTTGQNTVNQYTSKISNGSYLTDSEYEKLAADLAGIETDIDGNHSCTYEETLKYGEIIARLHKYGIKRSTSIEEAAAAAAGLEYKYGSPQITNAEEGGRYQKLLINLRKANETVASEAGAKVNEMVVGDVVKGYGSLSEALTGTHNQGFENYLREIERQFGTFYVFNNVFKGDENKYDPVKRAEALCGFEQNVISDFYMMMSFSTVVFGKEKNKLTDKELLLFGINLNEVKFGDNSKNKLSQATYFSKYILVNDEDKSLNTKGYISRSVYISMAQLIAQETRGGTITNAFGIAGALLNNAEQYYDGNIEKCLLEQCYPYGNPNSEFLNEDGDLDYANEDVKKAIIVLNLTLNGTRAFSEDIRHWAGNYEYLKINGLLNVYDAYNRFSTTHLETSKFI